MIGGRAQQVLFHWKVSLIAGQCTPPCALQAALPHLMKSRGNIVNMSSMMSQTHKTIQMAYNASKAMEDAVSTIFESLLHSSLL